MCKINFFHILSLLTMRIYLYSRYVWLRKKKTNPLGRWTRVDGSFIFHWSPQLFILIYTPSCEKKNEFTKAAQVMRLYQHGVKKVFAGKMFDEAPVYKYPAL